MENIENAIEVRNMSKDFKLVFDKPATLKERLVFWNREKPQWHHVLKDINLEIKNGDTIALVGTNGSKGFKLLFIAYANDIFSKLKKYEKIILNGNVWNKWKSNSDFKMELIKILYKFTSEYEKNLNRNYSEDKCKEIENTQMKGDILEKYFEIYFLIVFILSYLKIKMTVNNYFFNSLNKDLDS